MEDDVVDITGTGLANGHWGIRYMPGAREGKIVLALKI